MRTKSFATKDIDRKWYVVDVDGVTLGRAAARIAMILRGKHKPTYTPHDDTGDFVVVLNSAKAVLTGRKLEQKMFIWHTGYMGHLRERTYADVMENKPSEVFKKAVKGMLPRGILGRQMLTKLKVYEGAEHPHEAQMPEKLDITKF
jgi:large subunit ribosomal protein L13